MQDIVQVARKFSSEDHGGAFVTQKENDRIAQVYLRRALDQLSDEVGD